MSITKSFFRQVILSSNRIPRSELKKHFKNEINQFIEAAYKSYKSLKKIKKLYLLGDFRIRWVDSYLYNAIQNLISSFNIFISGYLVPSGNLMRQFYESAAMAILLSSDKHKYFGQFKKNQKDFKVNKVFKFVEEYFSYFKINQKAWDEFIKDKNFYHKFSHASEAALISQFHFESKQSLCVFGGHYDQKKVELYETEITKRVVAARQLKNIIDGIAEQLKANYKFTILK